MQAEPETKAVDAIAEFQAGVTAALRSWHPLRTAVEGEWGGVEGVKKAEDLRANIFSHFDGSRTTPSMTLEELEDNLSIYMEEEFSVVLEDGSERQVADLIWRMYESCGRGDVSLARQVVASIETVVASQSAQKVVVQEDSDMDEDDDTPDISSAAAKEYAGGSLFGNQQSQTKPAADLAPPRQLGEPEPEKPTVELDDDGFATVPTRKGRRSKGQ